MQEMKKSTKELIIFFFLFSLDACGSSFVYISDFVDVAAAKIFFSLHVCHAGVGEEVFEDCTQK